MFDLCILYEYLITLYLLSLSQTALNYINSLEQGKMHTAKKLFLSRNCQTRQMCFSPKLNSSVSFNFIMGVFFTKIIRILKRCCSDVRTFV